VCRTWRNEGQGPFSTYLYLFAAAHGLESWFHNCKKEALAEQLTLRPEQAVQFAHSVSWPTAAEARP
jgi:hypothetical protein